MLWWQIFIACAIPNSCSCAFYWFLGEKLKSIKDRSKVKSWYEIPDWVKQTNQSKHLFQRNILHPQLALLTWMLIFSVLGYASWRVWSIGGGFSGAAKVPLVIYTVKLLVIFIWHSIVLWRDASVSTVQVVVYLSFILLTGILFYGVDRFSGYLLIPYFLFSLYTSFFIQPS